MFLLLALLSLRQRLEMNLGADAKWHTQILDHFNKEDKRTFKQKYYENLQYVPSTGFENVVLYIGGESDLRESYVVSGSALELAKRTNAAVFALEHRFFGDTQPFDQLITENYKYLTIQQAMADLADFATALRSHERASKNVKFVVVGGSYPGALSSWFRMFYPDIAIASWASSAPVHIQNNYSEYDDYVAQQLEKVSPKCLKNTRDIFDHVDGVVRSGDKKAINDLKTALTVDLDTNDVSFLYILTDVLAAMVQYNSRYNLLDKHCEKQSQFETGNWDAFVEVFKLTLTSFGEKTSDFDLMKQTDTSSKSEGRNGRSWTWMTCNEVGWFQTASGKLRSSLININYFQAVCKNLFGLDNLADDVAMNKKFGGNDPNQTKVFFVNGDVDPWSVLSVHEPKWDQQRRTHIIPAASHCADLSAVSESNPWDLTNGQFRVLDQMEIWIEEETCPHQCVNGQCAGKVCACFNGWGGDKCDEPFVSKSKLDYAIIIGVSVPVLLVVCIIFSLWQFRYKRNFQNVAETPLLK